MNVFVSQNGVPRTFRNKRIYGGNSFNTSNIYETNEAVNRRHTEAARLTYETGDSRDIVVTFVENFTTIPVLQGLKIYRIVVLVSGKWVLQDVLHYLDQDSFSDETGFELFIDDSEDMEGVILNYSFTE